MGGRLRQQWIKTSPNPPPTPDESGRPRNFATIGPEIYRSSYPEIVDHHKFLEQCKLKTIVTFVDKVPAEYAQWIASQGITHHHILVNPNKEGIPTTDPAVVESVLSLMLDKANHPMLIHCNKGKHRTGCITACFRKVTGWTNEACVLEYEAYSSPKSRDLDRKFIKAFKPTELLKALAITNGVVGREWSQMYYSSAESMATDASYFSNWTDDEGPEPYMVNPELQDTPMSC